MLYVPAAAANGNTGVRDLPVPISHIAAGQIIYESDLKERQFQTTSRSISGIATSRREVAGREARRRLQAGRPIPLSALMKPLTVRRGDKVIVTYEEEGFSISTQLLALEDGGAGEVISLRNVSSGATVSAEIVAGGALIVRGE